jgi:hypothetical protein
MTHLHPTSKYRFFYLQKGNYYPKEGFNRELTPALHAVAADDL